MAIGALVIWDSLRVGMQWGDDGPQPGYFPFYIGVLLLLGAAKVMLDVIRRWNEERMTDSFATHEEIGMVLKMFMPTVVYVAAIFMLRLYAASAIFIAAFMRCGLGDQWTDHHTLALVTAQDGRNRFDHSSFEVVDFDDLVQGGEWLKSRGHLHSWGVGRHIQGSQLFDYWRDPFDNKVEIYTDGDLVNDSTPVGNAPFSLEELRQWAPPLTPEFMR